jgi:hypothetical protein
MNHHTILALKKYQPLLLKLFLSTTVVAMGVSWMHDAPVNERVVTLRYLILAIAGFISFVTPYLLFPDTNSRLIQMGNVSGKKLLSYLSRKTLYFYSYFFLFITVILFVDSVSFTSDLVIKGTYALYGILFTTGLHFAALFLYLKVGPQSQFWQESNKGKELRRKMADYFKYPMDPGAIPSLINTVVLAAGGMLLVIISSVLGNRFGGFSELLLSLSIFGFAFAKYRLNNREPERKYYHTNSFFSEFFGANAGEDSITARRKVDQLWWVPAQLRANVWQFLQQIDRKLPAGRAVATGHILVWLIAYQKPDINFMIGVWALFAVSHHLFILMTMQTDFSPHWLLRWVSSPAKWFITWFWMQIRWLLPLMISMNLQLFLFDVPRAQDQVVIIIIYLLSAVAAAAVGAVRIKTSVK